MIVILYPTENPLSRKGVEKYDCLCYTVVRNILKVKSVMSRKTNLALARLLYSSMFMALGLLLPFLTGQLQPFGRALLPMHLPVFICGFVCGPFWGAIVGFTTPLLRCFLFQAPAMSDAVAMAFELATYAFVVGVLYKKLSKNFFMNYVSLISAMVCGRIVWGAVTFALIFLEKTGGDIGLKLIWTSTVLNGVAGIVVQLVLIPPIISVLKKNRLMLN